MTYYYPNNLTAKATLWLWTLKDLTVGGSLTLVGLILMAELHFSALLLGGGVYLFLTIRFEDTSVLDYLNYMARFCVMQQRFQWSRAKED